MRRVLVLVAAALLVSGCATGSAGYSAATAEDLQGQVLAVTEAASEGDLDVALTRLEELTASTKDALVDGTVTEARHGSILAAIELVRADLEALLKKKSDKGDDQPAEEPATEGETGGEGGGGNSGTGGEGSESGGSGEQGTGGSGSEDSGGGDESGSGGGDDGDGQGDSGNDGDSGSEEPTPEPTEEPVDEEPVDEEPVDEEPVDEEPVDEEPVEEEPVDNGGKEKNKQPAPGADDQ